jgi:hypothetical protein
LDATVPFWVFSARSAEVDYANTTVSLSKMGFVSFDYEIETGFT